MGEEAGKPATYEGSDLDTLASLHRYQRWVIENFQPFLSGWAIEFGAGTGSMSALIRPHVSTLDLVEPSANLVTPLRRRFGDDENIMVYGESLEARLPAIADETYDSVILINVLEHIKDDAAALDGFLRILKPGGHLLLFVPALRFLYSDLDRLVGHFRRYQRPGLNGLAAAAGFDIIQSRYLDIIGVASWWLLNTVLGSTGFNPRLVGIYDAVFVPLSRALESLVRPPFGKNIALVAQKPGDAPGDT